MLKQADKVQHAERPEWGVGTIQKCETITREGQRDQRIWIKFPSVGVKTVLASAAKLQCVEQSCPEDADDESFATLEVSHDTGWLGEISKKKPEDAITSLPEQATDPFTPIKQRLEFSIKLYRFDSSGGSLIDWAVAQTGLEDPLSRFNRHQLEEYFSRWSFELDKHLQKLMQESRMSAADITKLVSRTPPRAVQAMRKINGQR